MEECEVVQLRIVDDAVRNLRQRCLALAYRTAAPSFKCRRNIRVPSSLQDTVPTLIDRLHDILQTNLITQKQRKRTLFRLQTYAFTGHWPIVARD
jgi:hypothetical protein